jgi:hypothetical protein
MNPVSHGFALRFRYTRVVEVAIDNLYSSTHVQPKPTMLRGVGRPDTRPVLHMSGKRVTSGVTPRDAILGRLPPISSTGS